MTAPAPAAVQVAPPPRSQLSTVMGGLLDLLVNPHTSTVSRDDQGVRHETPGVPLTRGQQAGHLLATALEGAGTAMGAPPGPGQVARGASAALGQQFQQAQAASKAKDDKADSDFAIKQQTKMDGINYQLGLRKIVSQDMELHQHGIKANQDAVDFSQKQADREKALGSFDMGVVADAGSLADAMTKQPDAIKKLYSQDPGIFQAWPVIDADGTRRGIQIWERQKDLGAQPYDGSPLPKFIPPTKPGEPYTTQYFTPSDPLSNAQADNYRRSYLDQTQKFEKAKSDLSHVGAETRQANAGAVKDIAQAAEARAQAAKAYADAEKMRRESSLLGTDGEGAQNLSHEQIVDGMLDGSVDITKAVGIFRSPLARAQFIADAKTKDPSWTMQKFDTMRAMRKDASSGKIGDQVQSFQTFTGHAFGLVQSIDTLRNTNAPILNTPINKLRKSVAGQAALAAIDPQIEAVKNEFQNFLANHALQKSEIERGEAMLNENQSPAQMQAAVKSFETVALTRLGAVNYRYKTTMNGRDIDGLIDPNSSEAIKGMGLGEYAVHALNLSQPSAPPAAAPAAAPANHAAAVAAGVPPGAQPGYVNGKLVGYQDATGYHALGGSK
jgi:hypothetical protein